MSRWRILFLIVFFISLGVHAVFFHRYLGEKRIIKIAIPQKEEKSYPYLDSDVLGGSLYKIINFIPLRNSLHNLLDPYGDSFGMYFEYLPTGTSIGINSNGEFPAASLFKLPVVMAYFYEKEMGKVKNTEVTIQPNQLDKSFGELWKRGAGAKISLDDAARIALTDSDNTAIQVLAAYIDKEDVKKVYSGLDIDFQEEVNTTVITPKGYSSILKSLFFASILSEDDSQAILNIMMHSKFHDKLPAGVSSGVPIAHKIGVYNTGIYSDCGVIYPPDRPYVLCMVSASDEKTATQRMRDASSLVYRYVSSVR